MFGFGPTLSSNPTVAFLVEHFQKFLDAQPYAMSASLGFLATSSSSISSSLWVLDFEASYHMSPYSLPFASLSSISSMFVMTTNDTLLPLASISSVITPYLSLPHVYHILNLTLNLVYVVQLCDSSYLVSFPTTFCFVQDPQSQKLIRIGHRRGGFIF